MAPVGDCGSGSEDEEIWEMLAGTGEGAATDDENEADAAQQGAAAAEGTRHSALPTTSPCQAAVELGADAEGEAQCAPRAPARPPYDAEFERTQVAEMARSSARRGLRVPSEIVEDPDLNAAIAAGLPPTHNFDMHRAVWRLRRAGARHVGLQMPEGLQQWALALADVVRQFVPSCEKTTIFGDVSFGACCIDDLGARAVGVDYLVHYGHSCIVPTDQTTVPTLYVHVEVEFDPTHLVEAVRLNFTPDKRLAFLGTVQFTPGIVQAAKQLREEWCADEEKGITIPQVKPLHLGETLGCTSPHVDSGVESVVFICDGRFHLESAMMQNPNVRGGFFRYDPFCKTLTREGFAHGEMHRQRKGAIEAAKGASIVGLVLSTLGRQGSGGVLEGVERLLEDKGVSHFTVLLSDVSPERLAHFEGVDAWVQVACPRLSIDWGEAFDKPLLTPYEAHIAFGDVKYQDVYPMDYYSNRGGPWSNYGAHNGHGGSLGTKFRHLKARPLLEYED